LTGTRVGLSILAMAVALSCVPAAAVRDPRGAAGAIVEPSAASRGEPFETSDGWTVRIEAIALHAALTTSPEAVDAGEGEGRPPEGKELDGGAFVWDGARSAELVVPGLQVGSFALKIALRGKRLDNGPVVVSSFENLHPDPTIAARLLAPPSEREKTPAPPSFFLAVRGEKAGRVVAFEVTVRASSRDLVRAIDVRADNVVFVPIEVAAEQLFFADASPGSSSFEEFADADGSGDGHLSLDELEARSGAGEPLSERLATRATRLLRFR
jgi:hypothetical protein